MGNLPTGTVTFLFTDIEGSTKLAQQYPDDVTLLLDRHNVILHQAIQAHNGFVFRIVGDAFCAAFHNTNDALNAAMDAQRGLNKEIWSPAPIKVRMGIHVGTAHLDGESDYSGYTTLALTQRIMSAGHGGQVLLSGAVSEASHDHLPIGSQLVDMGECHLKDILQPEHLYQLTVPDLPSEFPPLKTLKKINHNLPLNLSSFIGRERELTGIKEKLESAHLLTLLGPGGTGKTRLMLQVAEEVIENYSDGVWLVELAPLTDPDLIPERAASTLNIQEQPGRPMLDTLTDYLRRKELLLLLDNVEHLVRASAEFAEHVLAQCPKLTVLVTGREALFIDGETTIQIPSLGIPEEKNSSDEIAMSEGVQLFMERARAVRPDFALTEQNAATVAEIVRRLDGIPLALELAAARLRMLTVERIAARLNDRFRLLTGGRRTALPRQQTLQALIDWSWQLLDEQEHVLLRRVSVFSGGWTLEAIQAIAGFVPLDEFEVFDTLEQLINKSLVIVRYPPDGEPRYNMLESIRQFARDKLFEAGEGETLRDRHVDYFVALVDQFGKSGPESEYFAWMKRFSFEGDNLRAVVSWIAEDRPQLALHFTGILLQYDPVWLPYREACSWLEPIIERARTLLDDHATDLIMKDFIRALQALGWLLVTHGEMLRGHSLLDESIRLAREYGEIRILAITTSMKAQAMGSTVTQNLMEQLDEIIDVCRQNNYEIELLMALFSAGQAHILQGHLDKGKAYLAEVLQLMVKFNVPIINTWVYYAQALLEKATQNSDAAEKYLLQAIEANEKLGQHRMVATAKSELAHLYRQERRLDEAVALYSQTILSWQEQGHQSAVAHQLECFAYLAIARGQSERAARLLGAAQHTRQRLNALSTEPQEIADLERAMKQLAEVIGDEARDKLLADGAKMSLDDAVALALKETT